MMAETTSIKLKSKTEKITGLMAKMCSEEF